MSFRNKRIHHWTEWPSPSRKTSQNTASSKIGVPFNLSRSVRSPYCRDWREPLFFILLVHRTQSNSSHQGTLIWCQPYRVRRLTLGRSLQASVHAMYVQVIVGAPNTFKSSFARKSDHCVRNYTHYAPLVICSYAWCPVWVIDQVTWKQNTTP